MFERDNNIADCLLPIADLRSAIQARDAARGFSNRQLAIGNVFELVQKLLDTPIEPA
jgi:hypothetical protein